MKERKKLEVQQIKRKMHKKLIFLKRKEKKKKINKNKKRNKQKIFK